MKLRKKTTLFLLSLAALMMVVITAGGLLSFQYFFVNVAEQQANSAAEIVRAHLTSAMVNGTIGKRQGFMRQLKQVSGLLDVRVARGPAVVSQYGKGLPGELNWDRIEREVMKTGKNYFNLDDNSAGSVFRATIPYVAQDKEEPNCLMCHQVEVGTVLGTITLHISLAEQREQALTTVLVLSSVVLLFLTVTLFFARRMMQPLIDTADSVRQVVAGAREGDFSPRINYQSSDEVGQIAHDLNALMALLGEGLGTIAGKVAGLIHYDYNPLTSRNQITATLEMVESLDEVSNFKQAIEEDETKEEVYDRLSQVLREDFAIEYFSIYEMVVDKNRLQTMMVDGDPTVSCRWCDPQIMLRADACRAKRTGHSVDGVTTPGICTAFNPPEERENVCHICIPLVQSGTVDGVVQLIADQCQEERILDILPFIRIYLREASPVLEAKQLMSTLRESSLHDPMTGLHNRRFLQEYAETLVSSVERNRSSVTVMMIDMDYFKKVNDEYGHEAGDTVLKVLARTLKELVRGSDIVVRYGGEEFLILLLETNVEVGVTVAEKIRAVVEETKIEIPGAVLQKTLSIGVAGYMEDDTAFWQVVKYADMALYQAKELGRNRVVRYTPDMMQDEEES
jgi:diguanylate cyclase (GGDEF)-like protein